ncbi:MAG: hypothetical protein K2L07_05135 [Lachnospiraceae bacterium]|nr:hypothetical protein [Lachnospiraceae bacterium]
MNEMTNENWSQIALEVAKHSLLSVSLSGWPAAVAVISISTSVVLIHAIDTFAAHVSHDAAEAFHI